MDVLFFYTLICLTLLSSFLVIYSKNPVHSALWLIFSFLNASGIMILLGAEYIAMILIIVYVGAVVIMCLFVIMTLNIKFIPKKISLSKSIFFSLIFFSILCLFLLNKPRVSSEYYKGVNLITSNISHYYNNFTAHNIGKMLYTQFFLEFQIAGIILLISIVVAIFLSLRSNSGTKGQDMLSQIAVKKKDRLELVDIDKKSGVIYHD